MQARPSGSVPQPDEGHRGGSRLRRLPRCASPAAWVLGGTAACPNPQRRGCLRQTTGRSAGSRRCHRACHQRLAGTSTAAPSSGEQGACCSCWSATCCSRRSTRSSRTFTTRQGLQARPAILRARWLLTGRHARSACSKMPSWLPTTPLSQPATPPLQSTTRERSPRRLMQGVPVCRLLPLCAPGGACLLSHAAVWGAWPRGTCTALGSGRRCLRTACDLL